MKVTITEKEVTISSVHLIELGKWEIILSGQMFYAVDLCRGFPLRNTIKRWQNITSIGSVPTISTCQVTGSHKRFYQFG